MTNLIDVDKEVTPNKRDPRDARIEELERRVRYCEGVAQQYEEMYKQLKHELKTLSDRQGNIQAVYDYMTKVGSTVVTKRKDRVAFLNRNNDPLRLDRKSKFNVGDEIYYADERNGFVLSHVIQGIDWIDKHPRYLLQGLFGYVDESKIFATREQAEWQLDEWKRS